MARRPQTFLQWRDKAAANQKSRADGQLDFAAARFHALERLR